MKDWKFPAGEIGVQVDYEKEYFLQLNFKSSDCIMKLLLQVDAIRRLNPKAPIRLIMPYVPYARQDRVMQDGESHSLKVFCNLINQCNFESVTIADPHSEVTTALLDNVKVVPQSRAVCHTIKAQILADYDYLIAPDAGALKKIYALAQAIKKPVICASKTRDVATGAITGTGLSKDDTNTLRGKRVLVVDDICDGGKTFTELAKVLPDECVKHLYVTHGIFSKGKDELLQHYSQIYCYNDMSV